MLAIQQRELALLTPPCPTWLYIFKGALDNFIMFLKAYTCNGIKSLFSLEKLEMIVLKLNSSCKKEYTCSYYIGLSSFVGGKWGIIMLQVVQCLFNILIAIKNKLMCVSKINGRTQMIKLHVVTAGISARN